MGAHIGTGGNDSLRGSSSADSRLLWKGEDTAFGLGGDDTPYGCVGNDSLRGVGDVTPDGRARQLDNERQAVSSGSP
jgi:hypothetical protein